MTILSKTHRIGSVNKPHPFEPSLLAVFIEIARTGSFTEAGRRLQLSQSTVSAAVQRLEGAVGCRLLLRTARRVQLTDDGESMLSYAQKMVSLADDARRQFARPRFANIVRVGLPHSLRSQLLPDLLCRFHHREPAAQIVFRKDLSGNLAKLVDAHELDVAITIATEHPSLEMPLWSDDLVWVGNAGLVASGRGCVPLVVRSRPSTLRSIATHALERSGQPYAVRFEGDCVEDVIAAARAGLGMSVLPKGLIPSDLNVISTDFVLPRLGTLHYVLRRSSRSNAAAATFVDVVESFAPVFFSADPPIQIVAGLPQT